MHLTLGLSIVFKVRRKSGGRQLPDVPPAKLLAVSYWIHAVKEPLKKATESASA